MWPEKQALFMRNRAFNCALLIVDCSLVNSDGEMACAAGVNVGAVVTAGRYGGEQAAKKEPVGRLALRPGQACVWIAINDLDRGKQLGSIRLGVGFCFRLGSGLRVSLEFG